VLVVFAALALQGRAAQDKTPPGNTQGQKEADDDFTSEFGENKADLGPTGRNPYFILEPGYYLVLEHGKERLVVTVLNETKMVDGVETRVIEEKETKDGKPVEISRNYFAISKRTNSVYYFGEDVDAYKDGKVTGHPGSWLSGVNGARYGLMMPGTPLLRGKFYQEIAPGVASDRCEIIRLNETVTVKAGTFKNCMKTEESSKSEPNHKDYKLYAPGVGLVGDGDLRLVEYGFAKTK
jgi:hypothetical protein